MNASATRPSTLVTQPPTLDTENLAVDFDHAVKESKPTKSDKKSRFKGKIPELPKDQRDRINDMLDDGATYKTIQLKMAKLGVSLNGENISNWFNGGYQAHVREQEWRSELRFLRESAADLDQVISGHQFQETLIQLALTEIFRALKQAPFKDDIPNFIRLFNSLARLNREALVIRKYNDFKAKEESDARKLELKRAQTAKETAELVTAVERALR